jgi:hypothetical protein
VADASVPDRVTGEIWEKYQKNPLKNVIMDITVHGVNMPVLSY